MKAPPGKVIVKFLNTENREIFLGRATPAPIEAEVIDDSGGEWNHRRVIVLRMEGENWGDGTLHATVPRGTIVMLRTTSGRLTPTPGYVVVRLPHAIDTSFDLPQDSVKDIPNYGDVVMIGEGKHPFAVGDTAFFDVFACPEIKLNGELLRLVRVNQLIAFKEAA